MPKTDLRSPVWAVSGAIVGALLVAVSIAYPAIVGVDVLVHWPPLHADWMPRFGWRALPPVVVGLLVLACWRRLTDRVPWPLFLALSFAASWTWTMALAGTDGGVGISRVFERKGEYLFGAREITSIPVMIEQYVARIPMDAPDNWYTHVAGHPPGALLLFVALDRLGVSQPLELGVVVVTLGVTAVVAGCVAVRALGGEALARQVAPWWILAPTAVWAGVSADAVFTAIATWGLALLAVSATTGRRPAMVVCAVGAGLLLGYCVYLSYGLPLLGIIAVTVLWVARRWSPLPWAVGGALVVVVAFTVAGFAWWEAYPVLRERYLAGVASDRPYTYWVWANLAAWTLGVGLATWAALPRALAALGSGRREGPRRIAAVGLSGLACILVATLSGMSKAEVERIWLPFTFWALMLPALLPARWQRPLLATQVVTAVLVQQLVLTRW